MISSVKGIYLELRGFSVLCQWYQYRGKTAASSFTGSGEYVWYVGKDACTQSSDQRFLSLFFLLSRAEGSTQSSEENDKAWERRDGTPSSWLLCIRIREVSLLPAWTHARLWWWSNVGVWGRAPFASSWRWLPAKCREWQGQKPLVSLCSSGCAEARWCKPLSCCPEQQGSGGKSSISCCPHCSCLSPNFILLVSDRCRLTKEPLLHPSCCSHCVVRCVCPCCSTQLWVCDALPPAGAAPASLPRQVSALSCLSEKENC